MQKKHQSYRNKNAALLLVGAFAVLGLALGGMKYIHHTPAVLSDQSTGPDWGIYSPSDSAPETVSGVMPAKVIPIAPDTCSDSVWRDITVTLHEAFVINQSFFTQDTLDKFLPSFRMQNADVTYDFHRFLVIYGFVTHTTEQNTPHSGLFVDRFLRIVRQDSLRKPMQFGGTNLGPVGESRPFWAVFPLKKNENTMNILFCNFKKPTIIPLDFTAPFIQTIQARYNPV